ncbi:MAG: hypothetical protein K8I30_13355, partial [Anaerolineae bacterium]|nr:hypothetical protein [Anaerolineae bacterium]
MALPKFFRQFFVLLLLLAAVGLCIILPMQAQSTPPTGEQTWDLKFINQAGQFTYYDAPAGASTTGKPLDIGDFDGDGCGDLAITGQNATEPVGGEWRGSVGHIRIVMNVCLIHGQLSAEQSVPWQRSFSIYGAFAGDMAGTETYTADFNADGFDDLLFSAQNSNRAEQDRSNAGAVYVLFGSPDFAKHKDIDLRDMGSDIIAFYGATPEDRLGLWVEGGDFDGDGIHDLLVGANQADGEDDQRANAGEAWIIYGDRDMLARYSPETDLREPPRDATRIIGADFDDLLGSTVWGDDFNGDGFDDAAVSAALWRASSGIGGLSFGGSDGPGNKRYNSGETFIVFGGADLRGKTIDLATRIDASGHPIDDSISVVYGQNANDLLGEEIAAGDMDGDGRLDLILGTLIGDGIEDNLDEAGEAWIIYTHEPFTGQMFDLNDLESGRGVVIYPDQADSKAGDTLRAADLDRDGVDDLFYGAPDYDAVGYDGRIRHNAGLMAVIFGERGGLPHQDGKILLFAPPDNLRVRFIVGADPNDMMPYALAVGDMNRDGYVDIAPNAMGGDGERNDRINAGEIYVLSGIEFMAPGHVYVDSSAAGNPTDMPKATFVPSATFQTDTIIAAPEGSNLER